MTSCILSLWRWLLSLLKRRTPGSNGISRALWSFLQQLLSFVAHSYTDASSGVCGPRNSHRSVRQSAVLNPQKPHNDSEYNVIMASQAPQFLGPSTSEGSGLQVHYEDSLHVPSRPASPSGSGVIPYIPSTVQDPPLGSIHESVPSVGVQLVQRTGSTPLPDSRRRLNTQTSRVSMHKPPTRVRKPARQDSVPVSVHVVGPGLSPTPSTHSLHRALSRASQVSVATTGSQRSAISRHSRSSGTTQFYVTRPVVGRSQSSVRVDILPMVAGDATDPSTPLQTTNPVIPSNNGRFPASELMAATATAAHILNARYANRPTIQEEIVRDAISIPAKMLDFEPEELKDLGAWTSHIHPEGARYYYHGDYRFYTDVDLMDPVYRERAMKSAEQLYNLLQKSFPEGISAAIEGAFLVRPINGDRNSDVWFTEYYLAHHEKKTIFWLHEYADIDTENPFASDLFGNTEAWHHKNEMEAQYWTHWELFPVPHDNPISPEVLQELIAILVHSGHDLIISRVSVAPFSLTETQQLLTFVKQLGGDRLQSAYAANVVARTLATFAHERALHYAGLQIARLSRDQRVFEALAHVKTPLIICISPFLFFAPHAHLKVLEEIYVDDMINQTPWKSFIEHTKEDWQNLSLMATVLLAVNTAMLAIPSVDNGWTASRSPTQILSYISTISSIAGILTALILIRQYRPLALSTAQQALDHVGRHQRKTIGLETMAIMHSLPYASLMWAMTTFLGSFSALVLDNTHPPTQGIYGTILMLVVLLGLWCIYDTWNKEKWYSRVLNGSLARHGWERVIAHFGKHDDDSLDSSGSTSKSPTVVMTGDPNLALPAGIIRDPEPQTSKWRKWQVWRPQPQISESLPMHNLSTSVNPVHRLTPQPDPTQANDGTPLP